MEFKKDANYLVESGDCKWIVTARNVYGDKIEGPYFDCETRRMLPSGTFGTSSNTMFYEIQEVTIDYKVAYTFPFKVGDVIRIRYRGDDSNCSIVLVTDINKENGRFDGQYFLIVKLDGRIIQPCSGAWHIYNIEVLDIVKR